MQPSNLWETLFCLSHTWIHTSINLSKLLAGQIQRKSYLGIKLLKYKVLKTAKGWGMRGYITSVETIKKNCSRLLIRKVVEAEGNEKVIQVLKGKQSN